MSHRILSLNYISFMATNFYFYSSNLFGDIRRAHENSKYGIESFHTYHTNANEIISPLNILWEYPVEKPIFNQTLEVFV